jgi:hypothetical protein
MNINSTPINAEEQEKAAKKPIEFFTYVDTYSGLGLDIGKKPSLQAKHFKNARLIAKGLHDEYDVIAVWDEEVVFIYLGYWNDGIIE